uniref:Uncharacterized protein n=1 Tax=Arundo donax TaxID=35708 RepID=A0A0A9F8T2_ARUDO
MIMLTQSNCTAVRGALPVKQAEEKFTTRATTLTVS